MCRINPRYWMLGVFISLVTLLTIAGVGEVYLRYQHRLDHAALARKYDHREICSQASPVPGLIYSFVPGKRCGVNTQGYVDYEYEFDKPAGTYRIVVIGDSVAQGQNLPIGHSFAKRLEQLLRESSKTRQNVDVITLARSGYSTSQELIIFDNEAFKYKPDLVIWSYVLNDPAHPVYHNANGEQGRYFYEPEIHVLDFFYRKWFYLKEKFKRKRCDTEFHRFMHCGYRENVRSEVGRIGKIGKAQDTPVVFLIHPVFEKGRGFDQYTLTDIHEELAAMAGAAGLHVVDLLEVYRKKNLDPDDIKIQDENWFNPWHLNENGHNATAEFLFDFLRRNSHVYKLNSVGVVE